MNVLQEWVQGLSLMQQSVLITAVRGPDTLPKFHISKMIIRWFRRCVLISAFERRVISDPYSRQGGSFTGPIEGGTLDEVASSYLRSVDEVPHHFHMHLVHAAEILGYKHPDATIRAWWQKFYLAAVADLHLHPETEQELDRRLGDDYENWLRHGCEGESLTGTMPRKRPANEHTEEDSASIRRR